MKYPNNIKVGDNEMIELAKKLVFEYFTYLGGKFEGLNPIIYRDTKMFLDAKKHANVVCEYMNRVDSNPQMKYFYQNVQKEIIKL